MNKIKYLSFLITCMLGYAQGDFDIVGPEASKGAASGIESSIQNSVSALTGKVSFELPIGTLKCRTLSHNLSLFYSSQSGKDEANHSNRFNPTSPFGVGFNINIPKIVVDNNGTATKEDDTFYLKDGGETTKLVLTGRIDSPEVLGIAQSTWYFKTKKFSLNKITYHRQIAYGIAVYDYWQVVTTQGIVYKYGYQESSRDKIVAWGNWIGDSAETTGGTSEPVIWYLSSIEDQWNNRIDFTYSQVEQAMGGAQQTEATYLKEIVAGTGEKIIFNYQDKMQSEYYEPHKEASEPDAFQERYEKKYLNEIVIYGVDQQLIEKYMMKYDVADYGIYSKRFLRSVQKTNASNDFYPPHQFDYYQTGDFERLLEKVTYPMGGSVTYSYEKKNLFLNFANRRENTINYDGYRYHSSIVKDNYTLMLLKSEVLYAPHTYLFKIIRYVWNGQAWELTEQPIVAPIYDNPGNSESLRGFKPFFGTDYYGYFYKTTDYTGEFHMFYLQEDGVTWGHFQRDFAGLTEDSLGHIVAGNDFVSCSPHYWYFSTTYTRKDSGWVEESLPYRGLRGGTNNYMMAANPFDNTYTFFYLDALKNWQSIPWTTYFLPINSEDTRFYPSSSFLGFVSHGNPVFIISWDKNYNLTGTTNIGIHQENNVLFPIGQGVFSFNYWFNKEIISTYRFSGNNFAFFKRSTTINLEDPKYGEDFVTYSYNGKVGYLAYLPNTNSWSLGLNYSDDINYHKLWSGVTRDFVIMDEQLHISNNYSRLGQKIKLKGKNQFTYTNGNRYAFIKESESFNSDVFDRGLFCYMNKESNTIDQIDLGEKYNVKGHPNFGGYTPFLSNTTIYLREESAPNGFFNVFLHRIINDKIDGYVTDIVVNQIAIDNALGEVRYVDYTYDDFNCSRDNMAVLYGTVAIENKGYGNSSIGKVVKKYTTGKVDIRESGDLIEEQVLDKEGNVVKKTNYLWDLKNTLDDLSYVKTLCSRYTTTYYGENPIVDYEEYEYDNNNFLRTVTHGWDSEGVAVDKEIVYASSQYTFMSDANLLDQPYQIIAKKGGEIVSVDQTEWAQTSEGKIYANKISTGGGVNSVRLVVETTKLNNVGQVVETTNGKGQYTTTIFGYNKKHPIINAVNVRYDDLINSLEVTEEAIQTMNNSMLKAELIKLYDDFPNAMIDIVLYDQEGRIKEKIDARRRSTNFYYDSFGRLDYIADHNGNVVEKKLYNFMVKED